VDCEDIDGDWFPQRDICWSTAAAQVAQRKYDKLHEQRPWHDGTETVWNEKYSLLTPFHYRDGTSLWVSKHDLTPDDMFLGDQGLVAEQDEQDPGDRANGPGA
jgi:hypothetical protein